MGRLGQKLKLNQMVLLTNSRHGLSQKDTLIPMALITMKPFQYQSNTIQCTTCVVEEVDWVDPIFKNYIKNLVFSFSL
jgi:hypothetical protein